MGTYSRPIPVATRFKYHQRPSIAVKIEHQFLALGALPQTLLGELTRFPQTSSWWGGVLPPKPFPAFAFSLDFRSCGPQTSALWASSACCP